MQLEWSSRANTDRYEIVAYIAADNVPAALRMGDRIVEEAIQLRKFVESGRVGRIAGSRELVISGTDYIIMYRIRGDTVRILRVLHGRQRWPKT